ncbi:MAG: hypothetical protein LBE57_05060 [Methanosarcinales archaeon]|jgi:hypothetical protein|nr:hypothetical protein [Methanosarcinales archaeon]
MENGHVSIFEKACLNYSTDQYPSLEDGDIDVKDTSVIINEIKPGSIIIKSMTIKKEGLKEGKKIIPAIDKVVVKVNMTALDNG